MFTRESVKYVLESTATFLERDDLGLVSSKKKYDIRLDHSIIKAGHNSHRVPREEFHFAR